VLPHPGAPAGIVSGPDGALYFVENSGNRIDRISPQGRIEEFTLPNPRSMPNGIIKGPDGNLWFTEIAAQRVGRLTPDGDMTEYALPAAGTPLDIAAGPDGNVWVTIAARHAICRIATDGRAMAFFLPVTTTPSFIATGSDGNLWFTDPNGKIGRFTTSGYLTEFPAVPTQQGAESSPSAPKQSLLIRSP
jgi:virginiamycin B lyase